jgi:hypothetical protein
MFSLRHEFSDAWYQIFTPIAVTSTNETTDEQQTVLPLMHPLRFPFLLRSASIAFTRIEVSIRVKDEFRNSSHSATKFLFDIEPEPASAGPSPSPSSSTHPNQPLGLAEWYGVLRGAKTFSSPGSKPGNYRVKVGLKKEGRR